MPRRPNDAPEGYIPKITMSGIGCTPVGSEIPTDQCLVWGRATGLHSEPFDAKIDPDNLWTCLQGEFAADLIKDGKLLESPYKSARLFLPKGIQDVIEDMLKRSGAIEKPNAGLSVVFGFRMQTKKSTSKAGYMWCAVNMLPPTPEEDPLAQIRKEIEVAEMKRLSAGDRDQRQIEAGAEKVTSTLGSALSPAATTAGEASRKEQAGAKLTPVPHEVPKDSLIGRTAGRK